MEQSTPDLPLFVAVVLDEDSKERLRAWFPNELLSKAFAHHMTVKFKPSEAEVAALSMGSAVSLQVVGWADNGKVQCVAVTGFQSTNEVPHITVATDGKTAPKLSNDLLAEGFTRAEGPVLTGSLLGQGTQRR